MKTEHVFPLECVECGAPTRYPLSICAACAKKAGKERDAYIKYVKEQKEKNEK